MECDNSKRRMRPDRPDAGPYIHHGIIASANQVMKHAATRDEKAQQHNAILLRDGGRWFDDTFSLSRHPRGL